jgi:septum formation protein
LDHAIHTLNELSGKTHQVITACAIYNAQNDEWQFCIDYASVTFKSNQTEVMRQYVMDYSPLDKAGAYGIQDAPPFIDSLDGDIETVIGLPIKRLLKIFSTYAIV